LLLWLYWSPAQKIAIRSLIWVVIWYGLAKALEAEDRPIYAGLGMSGHTLKHLAAAVATGYFVQLFTQKYIGQPSDKAKTLANS
jgi:hypothetical protein